nr:hypothetical protein Iba_chr05eCG3100 [Ipomoea batatas]
MTENHSCIYAYKLVKVISINQSSDGIHRQTPVAPSEFRQPPATADRTSVSRKSHRQPLPTAPLWLCLCQVATPATASRAASRQPPPLSPQPPPTAPLSLASRTASHRRPHLCLCQVATPATASHRQSPPVAPPAASHRPSALSHRQSRQPPPTLSHSPCAATSVSRKSHRQNI